MFNVKINTHKK